MHAAEAIFAHKENGMRYHGRHSRSAKEFNKDLSVFMEEERRGSRPHLAFQLAVLAQTYEICRPVKPDFVRLGWYDVAAQTMDVSYQIQVSDNRFD